jgi:hypothetical protein
MCRREVTGAGWRIRARLCVASLMLLAGAAPAGADARWSRISLSPSRTEPYYVCPRANHRPRCEAIEDPTVIGGPRMGPLRAGAITAGPTPEISPALAGSGAEGGYAPEDLQSAYGLTSASSAAGVGQTIAIVAAYDDPNAEADLKIYRERYKLPECGASNGCFLKVDENGSTRKYPPPEANWAREISLDLDMASAICPHCHILLVEASQDTNAQLAAAERTAASLGANVISNSFAGEELAEAPEYAAAYDHPGIPTTAAAGDHGYGVGSPASNSHVIAVGGTSLSPASNARGWTESVWYANSGGTVSGTGSGCSEEQKPAWQTDQGCSFRTINDIAAVGDPNTPVSVYDSYQPPEGRLWRLLGGTSVGAPIVAAAMALAGPYTKAFPGAEALYLEAAINSASLNDVLTGSNGACGTYLCQAGPGYDAPSGLGTLYGVPVVPPPDITTGEATSITPAEARLSATVNPHGAELQGCRFEYGPTSSYGSSIPCASSPGSGTSPVTVSAVVRGLAAASTYHFRVAASYPGGAGQGGDLAFSTPAGPPAVVTDPPAEVGHNSLRMNGTVNPNGASVATCVFMYSTAEAAETSVPCAPSPGEGTSPVAVSASVTGLAANTTYRYRLVVVSSLGTVEGGVQTVTTLAGAPVVMTGAPSEVTATSATLNAVVDADGERLTGCQFEYAAQVSAPCATVPGRDEGPVLVTAPIYNLQPGTAYPYRIVASSASGTSYGALQTLTTLTAGAQLSSLPPPFSALPGPPSTSPRPAPPATVEIVRSSFTVGTNGVIRIVVRCPNDAACRGTITLTAVTAGSGGHQSRKRVLKLASGRFTAPGHGLTTIRLHLSALARILLMHARRVHALATILVRDVIGAERATHATVTLRASGAPRGR